MNETNKDTVFRSENKDERRCFTHDERQATLKRTYHQCACCGKPLTTKTMTMDHIIPLSRGGVNELDNMIALCYDCNELKGNMLYLPSGFYVAIQNKPVIDELDTYVTKWFQSIKETFDIKRFPLIAPRFNVGLIPMEKPVRRKRASIPKTMLFQWSYVGDDWVDEIQAICDIDINEIRNITNSVIDTDNMPVAVYSLRKLTTDKILAVCCILCDIEHRQLVFYLPWHNLPKDYRRFPIDSIIKLTIETITVIADYPIDNYFIATNDDIILESLRQYPIGSKKYGYGWKPHLYKEDEYGDLIYDSIEVRILPPPPMQSEIRI